MNTKIFLIPSILLLSDPADACESDKKMKTSSDIEINLTCGSCNTYVLTHEAPSVSSYILWEKIIKPSHYVMKDLSSLIPASCLPTIYCKGCKNPCAQAEQRENTMKAVYRIMSAKAEKNK